MFGGVLNRWNCSDNANGAIQTHVKMQRDDDYPLRKCNQTAFKYRHVDLYPVLTKKQAFLPLSASYFAFRSWATFYFHTHCASFQLKSNYSDWLGNKILNRTIINKYIYNIITSNISKINLPLPEILFKKNYTR